MPPDGTARKRYGLLTYTINQVLTQAQTPVTYRELTQRIHQQYIQWGRRYPTPLLEGSNLYREVLCKKDWERRARILLTRNNSGQLTIEAGALHGMTRGSILVVYPPAGAKEADKTLGHVRVVRTQALRSQVVPCKYGELPAPSGLPNGGRCRLAYRDYGDYRLRIAIDKLDINDRDVPIDQLKHLKGILEGLAEQERSFVTVVAELGNVEWLVRPGGDRVYLIPASGLLKRVEKASAPGQSSGSQPLYGPAPIDKHLATWLSKRFARIARANYLHRLVAPADGSLMTVGSGVNARVEMVRYPSEASSAFKVVTPGGGDVIREGDIVQFRVHNRGPEAVDVTLLFIDSAYGIDAYLPRPGFRGDNRIPPGKMLPSPRARVTKTEGTEHMIVIAVRAVAQQQPVDFSCLAQPSLELARGTRGANRSLESPLGKLLQSSLFAQGRTRGLDTRVIDNHVVRRISWRVFARDGFSTIRASPICSSSGNQTARRSSTAGLGLKNTGLLRPSCLSQTSTDSEIADANPRSTRTIGWSFLTMNGTRRLSACRHFSFACSGGYVCQYSRTSINAASSGNSTFKTSGDRIDNDNARLNCELILASVCSSSLHLSISLSYSARHCFDKSVSSEYLNPRTTWWLSLRFPCSSSFHNRTISGSSLRFPLISLCCRNTIPFLAKTSAYISSAERPNRNPHERYKCNRRSK